MNIVKHRKLMDKLSELNETEVYQLSAQHYNTIGGKNTAALPRKHKTYLVLCNRMEAVLYVVEVGSSHLRSWPGSNVLTFLPVYMIGSNSQC